MSFPVYDLPLLKPNYQGNGYPNDEYNYEQNFKNYNGRTFLFRKGTYSIPFANVPLNVRKLMVTGVAKFLAKNLGTENLPENIRSSFVVKVKLTCPLHSYDWMTEACCKTEDLTYWCGYWRHNALPAVEVRQVGQTQLEISVKVTICKKELFMNH
jgi:hypothetical protein